MMDKNYTAYGEEWKKEMEKLSKKQIIEIASKIGQEKERLEKILQFDKLKTHEHNQKSSH